MADWSARLPGYEGSYDGDLEATLVDGRLRLTLITWNPNYGGASGFGDYTLRGLHARRFFDGDYPDVIADLRSWAATVLPATDPHDPAIGAALAAIAAGSPDTPTLLRVDLVADLLPWTAHGSPGPQRDAEPATVLAAWLAAPLPSR